MVLGEAHVVRGAPSHLGALQKCPSPVHTLGLGHWRPAKVGASQRTRARVCSKLELAVETPATPHPQGHRTAPWALQSRAVPKSLA